ncbi:hypothetical protein SDC9_86804 [bioreactor metagenome]|uniref:Uncharacterized protein n=1 Tax=bioreactor metagenome TaxID=1076179 RepID=A0A644ZRD3_9ZZZZ
MKLNEKSIPNAYPLIIYEDFRKCVQGFNFYLGLCVGSLELFVYPNPESLGIIKNHIFKMPDKDGIWQNSMDAFNYCFEKTPPPNLQLALYILAFNWDKFINLIGDFIFIAGHFYPQIQIHSYLHNLHKGGFDQQIRRISECSSLDFKISPTDYENSLEFFQVRHLGVHNGWMVDDGYLKNSPNHKEFVKNEIRLFKIDEMELWMRSLLSIGKLIAEELADNFSNTYSG